jgi:hypothetical protein
MNHTTVFFTMFRKQSTPDFSVRITMVSETQRVCTLKTSPQYKNSIDLYGGGRGVGNNVLRRDPKTPRK